MSYIVVKKSKVHGTGVFAKIDIPAGSKIIEYVGRKIRYYSMGLIVKN